jgi:DNA-binding response OmpR family regulator
MQLMPATRIIVADDHAHVRSALREGLQTDGHIVTEVQNGIELSGEVARASVDLITLDLTLAGEDGLTLAQHIRATRDVPIVMITETIEHAARIACLECGADDHIAKPFLIREVCARVRNVLRRYKRAVVPRGASEGQKRGIYAFDGLVIDLMRREVRREDGELLQLTAAEFNLLSVFVQRPTEVLSRDELAIQAKGRAWSPLDRTIDVLVTRLRKRIPARRLIKSVRGLGYVFTGEVKAL